ncbi:MAG: hypothetical protein ACOYO1_05320 [Bacteroidales bacterium]
MKKIFFLTIITAFTLNVNAKVWRLNNNYGISADFSIWDTAYANANAYDTIYVEGSVIGYGNMSLNKPLSIIGPGYFLNQNPQTQKSINSSNFGTISFNVGSSGSIISGLEFSEADIWCGNISITKNRITNIYFYGSSYSNIKISQNSIANSIQSQDPTGIKNNIIIDNNIFHDGTGINLTNNYSGLINNNVIISGYSYYTGYYNAINTYDFVISNNIIHNGSISNVGITNVFNNICNGTQLPAGNGNQLYVGMSNVFQGSGSSDGQWQLKAGSPAIGAGTNGTDCGAFGGDDPYILSGLPSIPAVYQITTSGVGSVSNGLNVNVKAKTH